MNKEVYTTIVRFTQDVITAKISHKMSREILDPYNLKSLQTRLEKFGYQFQYIPETSTTMKLAEDYAKAGGQLPAVFLTDHQTQGRGREGRTWVDQPGLSILTTGLLRIKPDTIPVLADLVALHTCQVVEVTGGINLQIKYPNDLVIDDRKTGGLLVLNLYDSPYTYLGTSAGIGINVHYSQDELVEYPTDYGATALDLHTMRSNHRQPILTEIFNGLQFLPTEAEVFQTNLQTQQNYNNLWRRYSSLYHREVRVQSGEQVLITGKVVDTQVGKGVLVEDMFARKWFNRFDGEMKVRLSD